MPAAPLVAAPPPPSDSRSIVVTMHISLDDPFLMTSCALGILFVVLVFACCCCKRRGRPLTEVFVQRLILVFNKCRRTAASQGLMRVEPKDKSPLPDDGPTKTKGRTIKKSASSTLSKRQAASSSDESASEEPRAARARTAPADETSDDPEPKLPESIGGIFGISKLNNEVLRRTAENSLSRSSSFSPAATSRLAAVETGSNPGSNPGSEDLDAALSRSNSLPSKPSSSQRVTSGSSPRSSASSSSSSSSTSSSSLPDAAEARARARAHQASAKRSHERSPPLPTCVEDCEQPSVESLEQPGGSCVIDVKAYSVPAADDDTFDKLQKKYGYTL